MGHQRRSRTREAVIARAVGPWQSAADTDGAPYLMESPYRVIQLANAIHAGGPAIMSRRGCEATIRSPPQMVAGWLFRRVVRSGIRSATSKRSPRAKNVGGPGGSGRKVIRAIGAGSSVIIASVMSRL